MTSPEHHSPVSSERVEEMLAGIVKPLKWEARIEGSQIADTPFGHYRVDDAFQTSTAAGMQVVLPTWWGPMSNAGTQCVDIAAAKAACEADFVKRVASILSPEILSLRKRNAELVEALTPNAGTKAAYMGEFTIAVERHVNEGEEAEDEAEGAADPYEHIMVPWTTIKEIMAAIRDRARLSLEGDQS